MKALNTGSFITVLVASLFSGTTLAASTLVNVNATVNGTCQFNTVGTVVSFTLDPSSTTDAVGTVTNPPQFWCTKGTVYSISDNGGLKPNGVPYEMTHTTLNEYIPYTFSYVDDGTGTGAGKSSPINISITSGVANSAFIDASVGSYNDWVTVTITP